MATRWSSAAGMATRGSARCPLCRQYRGATPIMNGTRRSAAHDPGPRQTRSEPTTSHAMRHEAPTLGGGLVSLILLRARGGRTRADERPGMWHLRLVG